jgi:hypothetical protein
MNALIAISPLLLWSTMALAQATAPSQKVPPVKPPAHKQVLKPASVSGYVFALTEDGDLKPARMAKVYLLYSRAAGEPAAALVDKSSETAADVFRKEVLIGLDKEKDWEKDKHVEDATACRAILNFGYQGAIVDTLHWGSDGHISQFVMGDTDEDGKFEISIPPYPDEKDASIGPTPQGDTVWAPGVYLVFVFGSAGYNDAVWEDEVTVKPGETVKVKLAAPTKACLKTGKM